jgi:hypothetical protein
MAAGIADPLDVKLVKGLHEAENRLLGEVRIVEHAHHFAGEGVFVAFVQAEDELLGGVAAFAVRR